MERRPTRTRRTAQFCRGPPPMTANRKYRLGRTSFAPETSTSVAKLSSGRTFFVAKYSIIDDAKLGLILASNLDRKYFTSGLGNVRLHWLPRSDVLHKWSARLGAGRDGQHRDKWRPTECRLIDEKNSPESQRRF